jgi:hypothetical protein
MLARSILIPAQQRHMGLNCLTEPPAVRKVVFPIVAAGGEYVISPEAVAKIGNGDMELGHAALDLFVKKMRNRTIKTLQKLPGPKKD